MAIDEIAHFRTDIRAIGVDLNPLPYRPGLRAELRQGNLTKLPIDDESVHFGFSYATLIYVPDALRALEDAYRVLKLGGQFYFEGHQNQLSRPGFQEVLDQSPGARAVFTWHQDRTDPHGGFLEVHKGHEDEFCGFPYTFTGFAVPFDIDRLWQERNPCCFQHFVESLPTPELRRRAHHRLGLYEPK